ncbi:GNAT family N-acetyltransferase [Pelagibacterium lentulum]|uniref:GNAT family N-acetyltransferase n=1 Tax=Pelagibacterium lentulum TaxID=2029865 RepID=UPI0013DFFDF8|nr:GNAT family N-acetyltransferase [Pelagibacterium lentulum]
MAATGLSAVPSVRDLEVAMLAAWPALEIVAEGAWQARFANGLSQRANSINCLDPDDETKPGQRLESLAGHYRARGLWPVFRVTPLTGRETFAKLEEKGWQAASPSLVLEAPLTGTVGYDADVAVLDPKDPDFLAAQIGLQDYTSEQAETFRQMVAKIRVPAKGLVIADSEGHPKASLLCAQAYGTGVFLNVISDPRHRRNGLGRRLMASGLSWLADSGARHTCLQVEAGNSAAVALYLSMGFTYRYPYHYRYAPEGQ